MGKLISDAGVDFILVGDSVGTTLLGHETTIPVTIEDMVRHTSAVRRSDPGCLLVADLPFGEASLSFDRLLESCRRLMQEGGADAVKLEGGRDLADDVEKLVATGIPVLGHIGLLPQTVKAIGGYRRFGADRDEAESLYTDAISLEEAGCFAIIAEMVEGKVAAELAKQITPPLVGIGSGPDCDGQILVTHDLLGLTTQGVPSFVAPYANLSKDASAALSRYVGDVRKTENEGYEFLHLGREPGGRRWRSIFRKWGIRFPWCQGAWIMLSPSLRQGKTRIIFRELALIPTCRLVASFARS